MLLLACFYTGRRGTGTGQVARSPAVVVAGGRGVTGAQRHRETHTLKLEQLSSALYESFACFNAASALDRHAHGVALRPTLCELTGEPGDWLWAASPSAPSFAFAGFRERCSPRDPGLESSWLLALPSESVSRNAYVAVRLSKLPRRLAIVSVGEVR